MLLHRNNPHGSHNKTNFMHKLYKKYWPFIVFLLPGMMEEPFCLAGRLISPNPALGPEDIRRKSFAILESVTAQAFTAPETDTKESRFWVESIKSNA